MNIDGIITDFAQNCKNALGVNLLLKWTNIKKNKINKLYINLKNTENKFL